MRRRVSRAGASNIKVEGLPVTEAELKRLRPFEFQNWVIQQVSGTHSPRKSGDMGIDGYSFFERLPIQVKQSERVGRNVVDNFETAVARSGSHKGYIVAFSFTKGAIDEAARVRQEGPVDVELVEVRTLLDETEARATPRLLDLFKNVPERLADKPLQPPRPPSALPTKRQLFDSTRQPTPAAVG